MELDAFHGSSDDMFGELIRRLAKTHGRVLLLVDEYDRVINDKRIRTSKPNWSCARSHVPSIPR